MADRWTVLQVEIGENKTLVGRLFVGDVYVGTLDLTAATFLARELNTLAELREQMAAEPTERSST